MAGFDIDALLTEISPDSPCGRDISYDLLFTELEELAKGTAETQVGDHIQEGEEPDWRKVRDTSLKLLEESRDLRLVLYLTLSSLCLEGLSGFHDGLALLTGLVERHWEHLFPQLDPDDDNDPLERMNIIIALSPPNTVMSDQDPMKFRMRLMNVPLCIPSDVRLPQPSLRHILAAAGDLPTTQSDTGASPTMQLIDAAFEQTEVEALQNTSRTINECLSHLNSLDQKLIDQVGAATAPDFSRLERLLHQMQSKIGGYLERRGYGPDVSLLQQVKTKMGSYLERKKSNSNISPMENKELMTSKGETPRQALSGGITSKQEVLQALDMIVTYYEQNEPSSPVPLLIKRAKRLVGKSFVDIIRDISPDAMSQVTMVSGSQEDTGEE